MRGSYPIKSTPRGGWIAAFCEPHEDTIHIHVRDTGPGVPAEMVQTIFDPFVQVRDTSGRDTTRQGAGPGISRQRAPSVSAPHRSARTAVRSAS